MDMKKLLLASVMSAALWLNPQAHAAGPIHVMLLDGESGGAYHAWQVTTPVLKKELEEPGLFQVDVVTAPPPGGDFTAFHPDFGKYQVVVMNYDAPDERWPDALPSAFESFVSGGGGLVSVHAADNAFANWQPFNEMIGIGGWRGRTEKSGRLWFYKDGKLESGDKSGRAGNHGNRVPFAIT